MIEVIKYDTFIRKNLDKDPMVRKIHPVWSMEHKVPFSSNPKLKYLKATRKSLRSPPFCKSDRIGKCVKYYLDWSRDDPSIYNSSLSIMRNILRFFSAVNHPLDSKFILKCAIIIPPEHILEWHLYLPSFRKRRKEPF